MEIGKDIMDIVNRDFKPEEVPIVINELSSITLNHVMAASEYNLKNTRGSILKLAKGNIDDVIELTKSAKIDFRDVIMWATQEE
ncbi:hypothetical protein [Aquimarina sp. 2201CG14-23]|uniref:hypothetical protein n=1 Tax=Aquimarina mycalae TaxID=3040073 RepID=UPI002477D468|nr:hypothetical protein [Aquimarina sp. 2201CG14-23]MDH7447585.1 hypothetical protein [Aquimarina sp. 2201CG14-23]